LRNPECPQLYGPCAITDRSRQLDVQSLGLVVLYSCSIVVIRLVSVAVSSNPVFELPQPMADGTECVHHCLQTWRVSVIKQNGRLCGIVPGLPILPSVVQCCKHLIPTWRSPVTSQCICPLNCNSCCCCCRLVPLLLFDQCRNVTGSATDGLHTSAAATAL
jgi:hypothetical protein